jgi:hypothetical protein
MSLPIFKETRRERMTHRVRADAFRDARQSRRFGKSLLHDGLADDTGTAAQIVERGKSVPPGTRNQSMKLHIVEVCSVALLLSASAVRADPVTVRQITGGHLVVMGAVNAVGEFSIGGDGFALQGRGIFETLGCPCQVGESVTFVAFYLGPLGPLSGTVDGVTYSGLFVGDPFLGIPSVFSQRVTASIVIPADATTGTQLSFPFMTFRDDRFVGYPDRTISNPVFAFFVSGSGTATVTLGTKFTLPDGTPYFTGIEQFDYRFDAAPSATPEPASVLLMVTGAGAILARRFRTAGLRRR